MQEAEAPISPLRRPLVGIALVFMAGTLAGLSADAPPGRLWGAALAALAAALALAALEARGGRRPDRDPGRVRRAAVARAGPLSLLLLYAAVFLGAWFGAQEQRTDRSPASLGRLLARPRETIELAGCVADDPEPVAGSDGAAPVWRFTLRLDAIRRLPHWQSARGLVEVRLPEARMPPRYGESWKLAGVVSDRARRADGATPAAGLRALAVRAPGARFAMWAEPGSARRLRSGGGSWLRSLCYRGRRAASRLLARGLEDRPEAAGLMQALLLGYRRALPGAWRRAFTDTGTYHVFAISGQHITMVAYFIIVFLQTGRVCRLHWFWFVAPVLLGFTLATGLSASALRGCLMALLLLLAPLIRRRPDPATAMAAAALLILGADPAQLVQAGFILSFGVVAGLIAFCPPLMRPLARWLAPDPFRLQAERAAVRMARAAARPAALLAAATLAAWLVSAPLIAAWFNLVSPAALAANLAVVPAAGLLLLSGCLAVLAGGLWPWLGVVFNEASAALIAGLVPFVEWMARVPGGHVAVSAPPPWAMAAWFMLLVPALRGPRRWRGPAALGLAVLAAGALAREWPRRYVEVVPAGDVPAVLVKTPGLSHLLVQTGPRGQSWRLAQTLRRRGVNRLSVLALPAADARHAGAALDVLDACRVDEVWCRTTEPRSPAVRQVLAAARARHIPVRSLEDEQRGRWPGGVEWAFNGPARSLQLVRGTARVALYWASAGPTNAGADAVVLEGIGGDGAPERLRLVCRDAEADSDADRAAPDAPTLRLAPGETRQVPLTRSRPAHSSSLFRPVCYPAAMQLDELARTAGLTVLCPGPAPGVAVDRIGAGDHISRLLNEAAARTLLVTGLAGMPLLRVAELMGAPAVCLACGAAPEPGFLRAARSQGVAVLTAAWPVDETCRRLAACLDPGALPKPG